MACSVYRVDRFESLVGKTALECALASFACPLNDEVAEFLKEKSRQATRLNSSITYLVVDDEALEIRGYFTLVIKPFTIAASALSSKNRRLIGRFAEENPQTGDYTAAVYLIAQLGKNFAGTCGITGAHLLDLAMEKVRAAQDFVGGKLVLVEREQDREKLLAFYMSNHFKSWNVRRNTSDGITYDQMVRVIEPATVAEAAQ